MGGYVVIDDTRWERFPRIAEAVSWGWSSSVGKPVWGMQVVLLLWTKGKWKVPLGIRIWRKGWPIESGVSHRVALGKRGEAGCSPRMSCVIVGMRPLRL